MADIIYIEHYTVNYHNHIDTAEIISLLNILKLQNTKIMSAIDDLKAKVAELQTSVDAEQAQIQTLLDQSNGTIAELQAQVTVLQGELANGATAAQIAEVATSIQSTIDDIKSTVADVPPPPPPAEG